MKTKKRCGILSTANGKLRNLRLLSLFLFGYLLLICHGSAGASGTPISIYAPGFDVATIASFQLNGSATRTGDNKLQLTSNAGGQSGSAFWKSRIYLGTDKSFSAYFTFLINGSVNGGADGLAFVIQTSTVDAGSVGGGIGYAGISPSIAVEFDTYNNGENGGDNHIAIVEDGCTYCAHTNYAVPSFTLDGGTVGHVWVDYNGATDLIEVRLSTTTTRPASALVSATKDLATKFANNNVFVGFTAATGGSASNHYIQDLLFENSFNPSGIDPSGSYEQAGVYTITYHVTTDGAALAGATVAVNGETHTTDASGNATTSLADGIYPYTVSKTLYTSVTGTTTVSAAPVTENITLIIPPTIIVSPASLNLGYVLPGGISDEMSYTLSGIVLSPTSGNITITPPANFEVSFTSGSDFSSSAITAAYTSGSLTERTIYVRFKPTSTANYSGSITNSGGTATTQDVNLTGTSVLSYCTPSISTYGNGTMYITNVSTSLGISNFTNTTSNSASCYADYSATKSVTQAAGNSVSLSFTSYQYGFNYGVWIDYNDNGTFASGEKVVSLANSNLTVSTSFTIPSETPLGSHRMRIRGEYSAYSIPGDPCSTLLYGDTEDYTLNVEEPGPAISISLSSLDLGYTATGSTSGEMSYTLSGSLLSPLSGSITITPPANFEVSVTSGNGFSASAITADYTSGTLTPITIYVRFKPTSITAYSGSITNSGGSAITQNVDLTGTSVISYCPATTNETCCMGINNVTFNTINNSSDNANYIYTDYTALSTNVTKGLTYTLSITGYDNPQYFMAWFDWNNDADFDDADESYEIGSDMEASLSITIPSDAVSGNIRMRVRSEYLDYSQPPACGNVEYGECEDYTVNLEEPGPTISISPSSLDLGYTASGGTSGEMSYTLSGSLLSPLIENITITPPANFEVSLTSGSGFSSSAINVSYSSGSLASTPVYVRFKPTAVSTPYSGNISNSGGTASLQNVAVTGTSIFSYCAAGTNELIYMGIQELVFNTIDNITGTSNQGYNDFTGISTNVVKGQSYTLSVYGWGYYQFFIVWLDWNNDGDFGDSGEEFSIGSYGYSSSASIAIPLDAVTGNVRMRVRSEYQSSALPPACGNVEYGECEDYTVTVEDIAPIVWDGSESTDWNTAGNWSINAVPTASDNVTIPIVVNDPVVNQAPGTPATCNNLTIESGAVLTLASDKALSVNGTVTNSSGISGLVVESGASLIQNTADVSATVMRDITAGESIWHLFISPVTQSIQASVSSCFDEAYLDRYNESAGAWVRLLTDQYVVPDYGYSINFVTGVHSLIFPGTLKASPVQYSDLSYSAGTPGFPGGWNLAGNPYPCSINPELCTLSGGLNAFAYVYNGANYTTLSIGSNSLPGTIAPLQGFFVRTFSGINSLTLNNAAKTHGGSFLKGAATVQEMLKLTVNGNGYSDDAYVRFCETATSGFDQESDAYKLFGLEAAPQLYSMLAGDNATVNTLPAIETNPDIALGFKAGAENTYTIIATGIESFSAITPLMLEDMKTNTTRDLRINPVFSFAASPGDMEHRFNLHFKNSNGTGEPTAGKVGIYSNKHTVFVSNPNNLQGSIQVFDLTGRLLISTQMSGNSTDKIDIAGYSGILLVKVITEKGISNGKVFVN